MGFEVSKNKAFAKVVNHLSELPSYLEILEVYVGDSITSDKKVEYNFTAVIDNTDKPNKAPEKINVRVALVILDKDLVWYDLIVEVHGFSKSLYTYDNFEKDFIKIDTQYYNIPNVL